jgi:hypothetical protein
MGSQPFVVAIWGIIWLAFPAAVSGRDSATSAPEPTIRPGDGLFVTVVPCDNCARYLRVSPRGRIRVPVVGELMVAGGTQSGTEEEIRRAFAAHGEKTSVTVRLIRNGTPAEPARKSSMVFLFGSHLTLPIFYEEKMTLEDAIKQDREPHSTEAPAPARVVIGHADSTSTTVDWKAGVGAAVLLRPGDTIWVSFPR